jgi:hypothetical protein
MICSSVIYVVFVNKLMISLNFFFVIIASHIGTYTTRLRPKGLTYLMIHFKKFVKEKLILIPDKRVRLFLFRTIVIGVKTAVGETEIRLVSEFRK